MPSRHWMKKGVILKAQVRVGNRTRAGGIFLSKGLGSAPFQYKKMAIGCGSSFRKHFARTVVTRKPKYLTLARMKRKFPGIPLLFIDDTPEHLRLAKKHIPDIIPVHYSHVSGRSIKHLEKEIVRHVA